MYSENHNLKPTTVITVLVKNHQQIRKQVGENLMRNLNKVNEVSITINEKNRHLLMAVPSV